MSMSGYDRRRLYAQTRIASRTEPNSQLSSEPYGVDVILFIGVESQAYLLDASKIWRSFLPDFSRMCCGVMIAVWHKSPEPTGNVDDVVVLLFLVHGSHDLVDLGANGGVIPSPPVQECVVT